MKFKNKYPDTIYRVGVKAVIKDASGKVLCVHDTGDADMWSLPGGGLDHGDSVRDGLARELAEEIDYTGTFSMVYIGECIYPSRAISAYVLYVVFDVKLEDEYVAKAGIDAKEVRYLASHDIDRYTDRQAEIIKKFGFDQDVRIPISA